MPDPVDPKPTEEQKRIDSAGSLLNSLLSEHHIEMIGGRWEIVLSRLVEAFTTREQAARREGAEEGSPRMRELEEIARRAITVRDRWETVPPEDYDADDAATDMANAIQDLRAALSKTDAQIAAEVVDGKAQ